MRIAFLKYLTVLLLLAPLSALAADPMQGALSGRISYVYTDYQAEVDGGGDVDASSFSQRYTMMYQGQGLLSGGRAGTYRFGLGGEYASFTNSINGRDSSLSTVKALYNGDLLVAPGGLPFRLHLYCNDLHQTAFLTDTIAGLGDNLLTPDVVTDVSNGTHRRTGATLLVGIQNGSYLGQYRDTLSKFPRLLVDYSEIEVESSKSAQAVHYLQRDLAFVSLNKKDNWFHYRVRTFRDYLDPTGESDTTTRSYILGTIDPVLSRAWINLTNWIQLSTDATFSETHTGTGVGQTTEESYALNLFAVGRRSSGTTTAFTTYRRVRDEASLDANLSVPLVISQQLDRDTAYRAQLAYDRSSKLYTAGGETDFEDLFGFVRAETRQSRRYVIAPEMGLEVFNGDRGQGEASQLGVEVFTNRKYRPVIDWKLRYAARYFSGEDRDALAVNYWEQELGGRFDRALGARWRVGGDELLLFGDGDMGSAFGSRIIARTTNDQMFSASARSARSGATIHSLTTLYAEHGRATDLENRLQLKLDYLTVAGEGNLQSGLSHNLIYRYSRTLSYTMANSLSLGSGQSRNTGSLGSRDLLVGTSVGEPDRVFHHDSQLRYIPVRSLDGSLRGELLWKGGNGRNVSESIVTQQLHYYLFQMNGLLRRLADFDETLVYERVDNDGTVSSLVSLALGARYNPTISTFLRTRLRYQNWIESGTNELTVSAGGGVQYRKLAFSLDYAYGERLAGDDAVATLVDRNEQRLQVKVDKIF